MTETKKIILEESTGIWRIDSFRIRNTSVEEENPANNCPKGCIDFIVQDLNARDTTPFSGEDLRFFQFCEERPQGYFGRLSQYPFPIDNETQRYLLYYFSKRYAENLAKKTGLPFEDNTGFKDWRNTIKEKYSKNNNRDVSASETISSE